VLRGPGRTLIQIHPIQSHPFQWDPISRDPIHSSVIQSGIPVTSKDLAQRADSLIRHSSNRYLTTVRIAFRAKQRRFDDFDGLMDEAMVKPVQRAIIELSDEQDQPDLLPG